jgi:hypothetical protein
MKKTLFLTTLLFVIRMVQAETKSVEMSASAVTYIDPTYADSVYYCQDVQGDHVRLRSTLENESIRGTMYFTFNNSGAAIFELLISNENPDKVLGIDFNGLEREVSIPVTKGYEWVSILGDTLKGREFYSRLTLRNMTVGDVNIQKLRISGEGALCNGVTFNRSGVDADRLAPYAYLSYKELGSSVQYFYNEITISEDCDPYWSYFGVLNWDDAYAGLQSLNRDPIEIPQEGRRLLYSVWNTDDRSDADVDYQAKAYKLGDGVTAQRFGGEGEGFQSWNFGMNWQPEKTYCFLMNARGGRKNGSLEASADTVFYSLYWKEKTESRWHLQAIVISPYNRFYPDGSFRSFIEDYVSNTGHRVRKARYANQWVKSPSGAWRESLSAGAGHYLAHGRNRVDRGAYVDGNGYVLWSGGYQPPEGRFLSIYSYLQREPTGGAPPITTADEASFERDFITAIEVIRNPKKIEYYDLNGNRVNELQKHQIYITNTGEKVIFSR